MNSQRHLSRSSHHLTHPVFPQMRSKAVWKGLLLGSVVMVMVSQTALPTIAQTGRRFTSPGGESPAAPTSGGTRYSEPSFDRSAPDGSLGNQGTINNPTRARRYTPPPDRSAPSSTGVGGARSGSCTGSGNTTFTALAPLTHIGTSSATHPTFSWYVPDQTTHAIDFRLYVYGEDSKLQTRPIYQTEISSTPGIMSFSLPLSESGLIAGKRYYWQAALICDPNHGSEDLIIGTEITIVENQSTDSEQWYDLLQSALGSGSVSSVIDLLAELADLERTAGAALAQSSTNATAVNDRRKLQEQSEDILLHSENLTQIVESER